ncbi:MAG: hypothetical protein U1E05_07735 [Patescibacteria group bacterium]|nr:hypothetical protein [Patescibacteria group bacterium]
MTHDPTPSRPSMYSQIDVSHGAYPRTPGSSRSDCNDQTQLLRELLAAQDRQNELLEELIGQLHANQRQRANELGQWKQANPHLARRCRRAAEKLGKVQTEFLDGITQEISENFDTLLEGDFMRNEFIDRYGPRLAHLNGLLQVLSQLSATPNPANAPNSP